VFRARTMRIGQLTRVQAVARSADGAACAAASAVCLAPFDARAAIQRLPGGRNIQSDGGFFRQRAAAGTPTLRAAAPGSRRDSLRAAASTSASASSWSGVYYASRAAHEPAPVQLPARRVRSTRSRRVCCGSGPTPSRLRQIARRFMGRPMGQPVGLLEPVTSTHDGFQRQRTSRCRSQGSQLQRLTPARHAAASRLR